MAMHASRSRKPRPPIDAARLEEMALSYVGRFATSRAKLLTYLNRKVRERGWAGDGDPPLDQLAERMVSLGYVDDRAFALAKARSLTGRGYGERRVDQVLAQAGIGDDAATDARSLAGEAAVAAALRFAERRCLGPYAARLFDKAERERALAAMIRAGHRFSLALAIVDLKPGEIPDCDELVNVG